MMHGVGEAGCVLGIWGCKRPSRHRWSGSVFVMQVVVMFKSEESEEGYYVVYLRFSYVTIGGVGECIGRECGLENRQ